MLQARRTDSSSAAWAGTRIILRQVSPESEVIFDLIRELYRACNGDWDSLLADPSDESRRYLQQFLRYAATFLSNMGNYHVTPPVSLVGCELADGRASTGRRGSEIRSRYPGVVLTWHQCCLPNRARPLPTVRSCDLLVHTHSPGLSERPCAELLLSRCASNHQK